MVSSLIDQETKWWKTSVVRALFLPFEADIILKIPLSQNLPKDNLIWIGNKRGAFFFKSAYHIATNLQDGTDVGECSLKCLSLEKFVEAETPCKNQNILLESLCGWAPGVCKDGGEGY